MRGPRRENAHDHKQDSLILKVIGILWLSALNTALIVLPGYLIAMPVTAWLGKTGSLWIHFCVTLCWSIVVLVLAIFIMNRIRNKVAPNATRHRPNIFYEVVESLDRIASGDYNIHIESVDQWGIDHYGELIDKINDLAQELGSMERMRQEFVSNVSHEIQSPLTSISGFAALLKKEDLPEGQRLHYIEVIEAESKRLSRLSDNLLRLSLLSADEPALSPQPFRLDQQIQDILLMLEPQWSQKRIELDVDLDKVSYTGDKELLSQVWVNLLHNGIKFTPAGGGISVSLKEEAGQVVCILTDTGCGIPEESLARIFERFYKVDKARDRSKGGSGLGLSLVHKIVDLHGGRISVSSTEGVGSRFTITLLLLGPQGVNTENAG